jgi:hypothetical protein
MVTRLSPPYPKHRKELNMRSKTWPNRLALTAVGALFALPLLVHAADDRSSTHSSGGDAAVSDSEGRDVTRRARLRAMTTPDLQDATRPRGRAERAGQVARPVEPPPARAPRAAKAVEGPETPAGPAPAALPPAVKAAAARATPAAPGLQAAAVPARAVPARAVQERAADAARDTRVPGVRGLRRGLPEGAEP